MAASAVYVPGPFRVLSQSVPFDVADELLRCATGGFHPRKLTHLEGEFDGPACREPQSVVVLTLIVGLVLAALGYAFDLR